MNGSLRGGKVEALFDADDVLPIPLRPLQEFVEVHRATREPVHLGCDDHVELISPGREPTSELRALEGGQRAGHVRVLCLIHQDAGQVWRVDVVSDHATLPRDRCGPIGVGGQAEAGEIAQTTCHGRSVGLSVCLDDGLRFIGGHVSGDKTSPGRSLAQGTTLVRCVTKPKRIPPPPETG